MRALATSRLQSMVALALFGIKGINPPCCTHIESKGVRKITHDSKISNVYRKQQPSRATVRVSLYYYNKI